MCAAIRRRHDRERRHLDQRLDRRFALPSRTARERASCMSMSADIVTSTRRPPPGVVAIARHRRSTTAPGHSMRRRDEGVENVVVVEVPAFKMTTDGAGHDAEAGPMREVKRAHLVQRRTCRLELLPGRHVRRFGAVVAGRKDA